jgi:hypothetical protein
MATNYKRIHETLILDFVVDMSEIEFSRFVERARQLRTKKKTKTIPLTEADLIHKINTIYSAEKRQRYNELYEKFKQETITPKEHKTLLKLSDEFEILNAKRLELLGKLAALRRQSLRDVMKDLSIKP